MRGTIGYDAVMDILPYCNNKGLSFSAYSEIADCTGLGEYIYAAEVERLKSRGYFLLTEEKKDNIRCEGQRLSFPKMDEIKEVKLLITAEWGDYEVNFRIMYADGKHTANRSLLLFDWSVEEEGRIPIGPTYKRINGKIEKFRETAYAEEVTISLDSGYGIISNGNNTSIEGNIITSTSRNARLIQHNAESCIITGNLMEVLMAKEECRSGCGIYAVGDRTRGNLIKENIVRNVRNCGIFISPDAGLVKDNVVWSYEDTIKEAESENRRLAEKLDERNIKSIYE